MISAPSPENLDAAPTSCQELFLTATNSHGLTSVITQALRPNLVDVTFATAPAGLKLVVNSAPITAPRAAVSWKGYALNLEAQPQRDDTGLWMAFAGWSDGGAATHTVITPASPATYTATFKPQPYIVRLPLIDR